MYKILCCKRDCISHEDRVDECESKIFSNLAEAAQREGYTFFDQTGMEICRPGCDYDICPLYRQDKRLARWL